MLAQSDLIIARLSGLRGLRLRHPIATDAVDPAELRRRLLELAATEKDARSLARDERLFKHWGLLPRASDYQALLVEALTRELAGYYDPVRKRLTLSTASTEQADPAWAEFVLTHELEHALQDQAFDLVKFRDLPSDEDDQAMARAALAEGDAVAVMVAAQTPPGAAVSWVDPGMARSIAGAFGDGGLEALPLVIREQLLFPYRAGLLFVADLFRRGGWRAVDVAFRKPPRSSEQILHPERYQRGEAPTSVPALGALATLAGASPSPSPTPTPTPTPSPSPSPTPSPTPTPTPSPSPSPSPSPNPSPILHSIWGELGFSIFLRSHRVPAETAAIAADGWGGDRVSVVTSAAGAELGIWQLLWDTEADALEAQEAAEVAVDALVRGPRVERSATRSTWLGRAGTLTIVERRGVALLIVHAAPLRLARRLADELWATWARPAETR